MSRPDLSPNLVHFTKGESFEEAFQKLRLIIKDQYLFGSTNLIKGQHPCVCFTEAPLCTVVNGLANSFAHERYKPFGIMFTKSHIFALGGRPVIYQTNEEYAYLPDSHNWRHVTYEPCASNPIDWTWEREWRLKCEFINFTPLDAELLVPTKDYANRLYLDYKAQHDLEQDMLVYQYSQIMQDSFAIQYREPFSLPWRITVLHV